MALVQTSEMVSEVIISIFRHSLGKWKWSFPRMQNIDERTKLTAPGSLRMTELRRGKYSAAIYLDFKN